MIRFNDGRGWSYGCDGRITLEGDDEPARTGGEPLTMRTMLADFGGEIVEAHELFPDISIATIMAVIALESRRIPGGYHRDAESYRWEARISDYSAGLMQTLSNTAARMRRKYTLPIPYIDRDSLCIPRVSILCGVAYLHDRANEYETTDGMLLQAAYNAGGIYKSTKNEWHLRTFSPDRTERFAQWHNDALSVESAVGMDECFDLNRLDLELAVNRILEGE